MTPSQNMTVPQPFFSLQSIQPIFVTMFSEPNGNIDKKGVNLWIVIIKPSLTFVEYLVKIFRYFGVYGKLNHFIKHILKVETVPRRCSSKQVLFKLLQSLQENTCLGISKICSFIKKRIQQRQFPVNITKLLRIVFLQVTSDGCS